MIEQLSTPVRRLLALAILLGAVALAAVGIVEPAMLAYADGEERIAEARGLLARFSAMAERESEIAAIEARSASGRASGETLSGESDPIASAGLQSALQTIVASNGGNFISAQPLPPVEEGGLALLGIRVDLYGDLQTVQRVLHTIETGLPLLFVERASIRRHEVPFEEAAYVQVPIEVQIDVYGAIWREPPRSDQP